MEGNTTFLSEWAMGRSNYLYLTSHDSWCCLQANSAWRKPGGGELLHFTLLWLLSSSARTDYWPYQTRSQRVRTYRLASHNKAEWRRWSVDKGTNADKIIFLLFYWEGEICLPRMDWVNLVMYWYYKCFHVRKC